MTRRALDGFAEDSATGPARRMMPEGESGGASAWSPEGGTGFWSRHRRAVVAVPTVALLVAGTIAGFALPNHDTEATEAVPAAVPSPTVTPTPTEEVERPAGKAGSRSSDRGALTKARPKTIGGFVEDKPEQTGSLYATETLNVRAEPSVDAEKVGSIARGAAVAITDTTRDDWQEIILDGDTAWVSADYLSSSKPTSSSDTGDSGPDGSSGSGSDGSSGSDSGSGSSGSDGGSSVGGSGNCPTVSGLTGAAQSVLNQVCGRYGAGISSYGGYRPGDSGYHGSGQAVDFMISDSSVGREVADYLRNNASSLGVSEVIYAQRIWTSQRAGEGWRSMPDRGSATANHYDHVHVSVTG